MSTLPDAESFQFDALWVVSDLHLGGRRDTQQNFQIFDRGELFRQTIQKVIEHPIRGAVTNGRWCLVVNGDLVDFLAEPSPKCFDPEGAKQKLNSILGLNPQDPRPEFKPVWDALRAVARTPNATLVIVLGNHDVELALPWVRPHLLNALTDGDGAAERRVHFVFDGTGFHCIVGRERVLCVHGNEVDSMNYVDYEYLRTLGRDIQFGQPVTDWIPNGGSQLVIEAMNPIKQRFPFVDLLKPESATVLGPTLLALDPSLAPVIRKLAVPFSRGFWAGARKPSGLLSDESDSAYRQQMRTDQSERRLGLLLNEWERLHAPEPRRDDRAGVHLRQAQQALRRGLQPLDLLEVEIREAQLNLFDGIWAYIKVEEPHEALRQSLKQLATDQSFELAHEDDTFKKLDEKIGDNIRYVITGHTHFPRAIKRKRSGFYYNSGTWVRRIRLTPAMLASENAFKRVFEALQAGTMAALDQEPDLILRQPILVSLWHDHQTTHCNLQRATDDNRLEIVPNSESFSL